jgi:hypothetical protein
LRNEVLRTGKVFSEPGREGRQPINRPAAAAGVFRLSRQSDGIPCAPSEFDHSRAAGQRRELLKLHGE